MVRKKDEAGNYINFRQCGDYSPLNAKTTVDRYFLLSIEDIFNHMGGAHIFSKLYLRSGYHFMILWEWMVVPFGMR